MPLINVQIVEGSYDRGEKDALIQGFTDAVVAVKGEVVRPFVTVTLNEVKSGDWASGGQQRTTEAVLQVLSS